MNEFDDPELASLLRRAGGTHPDVNVAYQRVLNRVHHARRRRLVVLGTAASGLLLATGALALNRIAATPGGPGDRPTFDASLPIETSAAPIAVTSSLPGEDPPTSDDPPTGGTAATIGTGHSSTTVSDTEHDDENGGDTSTPPPSSATEVFEGTGGSVTVRLHDGEFSLVSYVARAGYEATVNHSGGDRVEVRFNSPGHRTNIRVDLEDDGMEPSVEEDDT